MTQGLLETIEVETGAAPSGSVIWLHGLGADGHDFEPAVPQLIDRRRDSLRFVFPNAPVRPVSVNGGYPMRAWYDISGLDRHSLQDEVGIRASQQAVGALIERETERGIGTDRIVLAGFSQGGALALLCGTRLPQRLAGIIALSCYPLLPASFAAERTAANQTTPIFLAHGSFDPVVDPVFGQEARQLLVNTDYAVQWHSYPMAHSVSGSELSDIATFLQQVLP